MGSRARSGRLRRVVVALALVATGAVWTGVDAAAVPPGFVVANGTRLEIDGHPWRMHGASTYGTSNPGGPTSVADLVSLAVKARLNTLRIVNMFDESGVSPTAPTSEGDWQRVDQLLARMRAAGVRAILDLSAFRNHLHERELVLQGQAAIDAGDPIPGDCSGRSGHALARCTGVHVCLDDPGSCVNPYHADRAPEWDSFLGWVASRVNTVTGVAYRDDPTIAIVAFAGEPAPPNSGEPLRPATQELTDFYERTFDQWKSYDPNHLVTTGGLLHIDWEEVYGNPNGSGIDHEAIFALPNQDVLSIHNYFPSFPPTAAGDHKTPKIAAAAEALDKPWITEEFGFLQAPTDGVATYTEADRAEWFRRVYRIQRVPQAGVASAGAAFWNLGFEVDPGSHDVNRDTPATWTVVQQQAPTIFGQVTSRSVSIRDDGTLASRRSRLQQADRAGWVVSADGSRVVFSSEDSAMVQVPGGLNGYPQVYVRDLEAHDTILVSEDTSGGEGNATSLGATISADGTIVAFESDADDLAPNHGPGRDIFVRNLVTGVTEVASISNEGAGGGQSNAASISADGRYVVFHSGAALVPEDTNGVYDAYLRDLGADSTELISVATDGTPGNAMSLVPAVSDDGRFVVFRSDADNLVADDGNAVSDIFIRDRVAGTTERVSVASDGSESDGPSYAPFIAEGDLVVFGSVATDLWPGVPTGTVNVFVRDLSAGTTRFLGSGNRPSITSDGSIVSVPNGSTLTQYRLADGATSSVSYGTTWGTDVTGRFVASSREANDNPPVTLFDLDTPPDIEAPSIRNVGAPTPQPVDDGDRVAIFAEGVDDRGVEAVEYFVGSDPGEGAGTPVSFTGVDPVRIEAFVEMPSLGSHMISLRAGDGAGNWGEAIEVPVEVSDGEESVSTISPGPSYGYFITTDPDSSGASPADPFETVLGGQGGGTFSIHEERATPTVPDGMSAVPYRVTVAGTALAVDRPMQTQVRLDASILPAGAVPDDVVAFADGVVMPPCDDLDTAAADPDPCIFYRTTAGDDVRIWLFSTSGRTYTFAVPDTTGQDTTPPTVVVDVPHEGAVFGLGQRVDPAYSCEDEEGGSGIVSCYDSTDFGRIDTSFPGPNLFHATGIDQAGNRTTVTRNYIVADTSGADRDGDGLLDRWETNGIDVDDDGTIDLALHQAPYSADPDRKDVFVEIDWMDCSQGGCRPGATSHGPVPGALDDVVAGFAAAPVSNPDGSTGITLHPIVDEEVPEVLMIDFGGIGGGPFDGSFDTVKLGDLDVPCDGSFGTAADRAAPDCLTRLAARGVAFHYGLFGHAYRPSGSSGVGEIEGNDFMVTVGSWSQAQIDANGGRRAVEAGTFMHEIGHNFGLLHGGLDSTNCKPNYLSVMSYAFQFPNLDPTRPLDYSGDALPYLNEEELHEPAGVSSGPAGRFVVFGDGTSAAAAPADGPIDWNMDGDTTDSDLWTEINAIPGLCNGDNGPADPYLRGHDDWADLLYAFQSEPNFVGGAHVVPDAEVTVAQATEAARSIDFDGDGVPNADDTCPEDANDLDGDGLADACDPDNQVRIDIMPGSATNPIKVKATGKIPVAILSRAGFSAPARVDRTSLTFGRTGDEASLVGCEAPKDVNGDGRRDLVCQFSGAKAGFRLGDTVGILRGATVDGPGFEGTDRVTIKR